VVSYRSLVPPVLARALASPIPTPVPQATIRWVKPAMAAVSVS